MLVAGELALGRLPAGRVALRELAWTPNREGAHRDALAVVAVERPDAGAVFGVAQAIGSAVRRGHARAVLELGAGSLAERASSASASRMVTRRGVGPGDGWVVVGAGAGSRTNAEIPSATAPLAPTRPTTPIATHAAVGSFFRAGAAPTGGAGCTSRSGLYSLRIVVEGITFPDGAFTTLMTPGAAAAAPPADDTDEAKVVGPSAPADWA